MPPSIETQRPASPLSASNTRLPSPKRSPQTPPRTRNTIHAAGEEDVDGLLQRLQSQIVLHAQGEVQTAHREVREDPAEASSTSIDAEAKTKKIFTAPDGEQFDDERKYKRYVFQKFYCFKDQIDQVLVRKPGEIRGQPFNLANLKGCEVQLLDHIGQVFVDDLVNCKVYIGACGADVFVRNCVDCTFTIASKQLRIRDCSFCQMYLYTTSRPALEASHHMQLAPFNGAYPRQGSHFRQAKLDPEYNQWDQVHNFSRGDDIPKPHWSKLPKSKWEKWEIEIPGIKGKPENPVKQESNALWFTRGVTSGPINGIKTKSGSSTRKPSLFAKLGPKFKK